MKPEELIKDGKIDARHIHAGAGDNLITTEECDELRRKFNGHHGAKAYAEDNGFSRKTISKHLKGECNCANEEPALTHSPAYGWVSYDPLNDPANLAREDDERSIKEIANKYGVHRSTISRAFKRHDI